MNRKDARVRGFRKVSLKYLHGITYGLRKLNKLFPRYSILDYGAEKGELVQALNKQLSETYVRD